MKTLLCLLFAGGLWAAPLTISLEGIVETWTYEHYPNQPGDPLMMPSISGGDFAKFETRFDPAGLSGIVIVRVLDKVHSFVGPYDPNFNYGDWPYAVPTPGISQYIERTAALPGGLSLDTSCSSTGPCSLTQALLDLDRMEVIRYSSWRGGAPGVSHEVLWDPAAGDNSWSVNFTPSTEYNVSGRMTGTLTRVEVADPAAAIPEPSTWMMAAPTLLGLISLARKRR
jgi:hypothetical protein